jgi:hypothetical protein
MSIGTERRAIETALNNYRERLDTIPEELFTETPPGGGWSLAEVYSHIMQATLGSTIALERCTHGNCEPTTKGPTWEGRLVMLLGRFLPVKIKMPVGVAEKMLPTKISKEEAKNLIIKCRQRVETSVPLVPKSSPGSRYKHPRLGMLNANQWFKFIRIHLEHHLRQLDRIKRKLI